MTTIAVDPASGTMCADTNVSDGNQKWKCNKIEHIENAFYGAAGGAIDVEKFFDWLREWKRSGKKPRKPKLDEDEFQALSIDRTGTYFWDSQLYPMRLTDPMAVGSGAQAARAAMLCGADIERAVRVACEVDDGSNLPITTRRVSELEEQKQ
jgi:hypothetical protein